MKKKVNRTARHHKKPPLRLPLPQLFWALGAVGLIIFAADFLQPVRPSPTLISQPARTPERGDPIAGPATAQDLNFTPQQLEINPGSGDSLWSLAETYLGDGSLWNEIAAANKISGMKLTAGRPLIIPLSRGLPVLTPARSFRLNRVPDPGGELNLPGLGRFTLPPHLTGATVTASGQTTLNPPALQTKTADQTLTYHLNLPSGAALLAAFLLENGTRNQAVVIYRPVDSSPSSAVLALFDLAAFRPPNR